MDSLRSLSPSAHGLLMRLEHRPELYPGRRGQHAELLELDLVTLDGVHWRLTDDGIRVARHLRGFAPVWARRWADLADDLRIRAAELFAEELEQQDRGTTPIISADVAKILARADRAQKRAIECFAQCGRLRFSGRRAMQ